MPKHGSSEQTAANVCFDEVIDDVRGLDLRPKRALHIRPGNSGGSWESHSKRQLGMAETFWLILRYFVVNSNISYK
jgi:hypothetical protein